MVNLTIVDIDISEHDLIGNGTCTVGQTCRIGQAEVTITAVPCNDNEIQVRYPATAEFRDAYKGLWIFDGIANQLISGYHSYPDEGSAIESASCTTSTPVCNRENIFNIMLSQTRFIAPTDEINPVEHCKITNLDIPGIPAGDDPIRTTVDRATYSVTNYTRYDHALHSGRVTRRLIERDGFIIIDTSGEGFGILPFVNNLAAPSLLKNQVDAGLIQAVQETL